MNTTLLLASLQRTWRHRTAGPRPLVWALALAGVATHAIAPWAGQAQAQTLPTGLRVVAGQATTVQSGNQLTVNNSAGAVLNWQTFNIGAANAVRFEQPSATSKVLNRVVGSDPSQIFGSLSSNGEVWLVNPYGVLFGRDARVDVGSLVVSTLNIGNDDWRAGRFSLTGGAGGAIVNQGELLTTTGGRVLLLAGAGGVRNEGLITAPDGQVALAAGASIDLVDDQTRHVAVRMQAPQGEVLNLGSVAAGGGRVDLLAAMVNQQGFVRAESLSGQGGEIVLQGSQGVNLAAGSVTSASGVSGGTVQVDGGSGTTMLAGQLRVSGSAGAGGDALLLGRQVGLLDGAAVDASGTSAGGRVRVGGGLRGQDTSVTNAQAVYMDPGARIGADATRSGDGGTIVLWSDQATRAYGSLSARGGPGGGNGGLIETSGGWLDARPASVRTDAPQGRAGQWLLDPNDLLITTDTNDAGVTAGPNFTTTTDSARINDSTIAAALQAGNNVTVTTGSGGANTQAGDITISSASITADPAQAVSLTISAARNITVVNSSIQSTHAPLNVTLSAANGSSGTGSISVTDSQIITRGGNITLGGGTQAVGPNITSPRAGAVGISLFAAEGQPSPAIGVNIVGSTLDAGTGNVSITGLALPSGAGGYGVMISDGFNDGYTSILGKDISIYGWVDGNGAELRRGVYMTGPASIISATHGLMITGVANSTVYQTDQQLAVQPIGVSLAGGTVSVQPAQADVTAFLAIDGTVNDAVAGGPGGLRAGVLIGGNSPLASAGGGAKVNISGHDLRNDPASTVAIEADSDASLKFSGAGAVTIDGNTRVNFDATVVAPFKDAITFNAGDVLSFGGFLSGDPNTVTFSGRDIDFGGTVFVGSLVPTAVTLTASRDVRMLFGDIESSGAPISIAITAAAGSSGAGTVELRESYLYSGDGDITIGGGSTAVGPNLTAPSAAAVATGSGSSAAGVALLGSYVDAGTGALRIRGQSVSSSADTYGVLLAGDGENSTSLYGGIVDIVGWVDSNAAFKRTGVFVDSSSSVDAQTSLSITGTANSTVFRSGNVAPIGVQIDGALATTPLLNAPLTIVGTTNDGARSDNSPARYGVLVSATASIDLGQVNQQVSRAQPLDNPPGPSAATITGTDLSANDEVSVRLVSASANFANGSGLSVQGNHQVQLGGSITAPTNGPVTVHAGTTLTLDAVNLGGLPSTAALQADGLLLAGGALNFQRSLTSVTLQAPEVRLGVGSAFSVSTRDSVRVLADRWVTDQTTTLYAEAEGTSITVAGYDGQSNITSMQVLGAAPSLQAEVGRWLIYAKADDIPTAGLNYSFSQYAMSYPAAPTAGGNGIVYALAPVLTLSSATPITKAYDGSSAVTTPNVNLTLTGLRPGQSIGPIAAAPTLTYAGTAVASNALLGVAGYVQPGITDQNQRPVYGYTTQFAVLGSITPRPLTLAGVVAATKVYDGSRAASLSGGALGNVVAGETLGLAYGGALFDTANAGSGKTVTGQASLVNGTGLASNYALAGSGSVTVNTGTVLPGSLVYLAQPATLNTVQLGSAVLTGSVSGFIEGETLASATSGTLSFTTPATAQSAPGSYAILGSGLLAANYTFSQAESNGTALTLLPTPVEPSTVGLPEIDGIERAFRQALPPLPRGPEGTRTLDALQSLRVDANWLSMSFGELDLSTLSREEVAALLEARRQYKASVLSVGSQRLAADPSLADVPACQTVRQAESGRCLVTAELLAAVDAGGESASIAAPGPTPAAPAATPAVAAPGVQVAAQPLAPPTAQAAAALPAPAAPPAPAAAAATAAGAATATAAVVAEPRLPPRVRVSAKPVTVSPPLPAPRAVRSASIPQIQRKIAVLVGIDNYVDERIPALENAGRDADAVARILESRLGYETIVVRDAGREAMVGLLNKLALQVRPNDSVVVYYAGHGIVLDGSGEGYWIPATANAERPETWLSNRDIGKLLGGLRASQVVLISDSCFSGSLVGDKRVQATTGTDPRPMLQRRATLVMSSGGEEPVADGARNGHSPFANSLMGNLQGLDNWRAGGNLFARVLTEVTQRLPQTPRYGPARNTRYVEGGDYLFEQRQLGAR